MRIETVRPYAYTGVVTPTEPMGTPACVHYRGRSTDGLSILSYDLFGPQTVPGRSLECLGD